jgi:hypothetical protein
VISKAIIALTHKLRRPLWTIRIITGLAIATIIGVAGVLVWLTVQISPSGQDGLLDILQGAESAINELIFLSLAVLFFATWENRIKRKAALDSLHRLRSIAHVVDMHQLTKDPAYLLGDHAPTATSPERQMTAYELTRYLDYCSELLAIVSKLAALHAQYLQDTTVLNTVNDVENLAHGLSGKIWQKIMILDVMAPEVRRQREND